MKKIGVFGGAFNPPHKGHVRLARDFADRLSLTEVMVIPSFIPPHKSAAALVNAQDRLEMCRLAFCDDPRFTVSATEIERGGKSYTYDTLLEIKKSNPGAALYLIIGSDMFLTFHTWRRYEDILKICTLCTAARENGLTFAENPYNALISDLPALELNSTAIREKLKNGEDIEAYVGGKVAGYINGRGLYRD
jgi:nicotinate-nucleotide adenylyltransferase